MEFEFHEAKSERNRAKHGIDFHEAEALWQDPNRLEIPARTEGEPRMALIARIRDETWTAIFTLREHRIRIISVRRARGKEQRLYDELP